MAESTERPCPHCGEPIPTTVPVCAHCGRLADETLLNSGASMRIEHVWILAAIVTAIVAVMVVVIFLT